VETLTILTNEAIARGVYQLVLEGAYPLAEPGQFACVYLGDGSRLLPRPLGVCAQQGRRVTFVYAVAGGGTLSLSRRQPGARLRVGPPSGRGFRMEAALARGGATLVAGGVGAAPLLLLAETFRRRGPKGFQLRAVLGFRDEIFLTRGFERICDNLEVATETGAAGVRGTALDVLRQDLTPWEHLFGCGPRPMLEALAALAQAHGVPLQISLEERMGCGYGACLACVCDTVAGHKKICEDGPVFDGEAVLWHG
jgi:dihydroorotate dehydrogenase electron transfer subunit